ncbi:LysR family transcriptional regulator [Shimia biformata]|uniref:LysR family transcriptional regulator n=1 Tax=Shimia biformata TaxID=1294299 RepID=UPI00194FA3E3|nr:LysR family transcriptional regulator [Shimia biformata]
MDHLAFMESLVAAVETGSLTRAAKVRRISQPALSQQITALEAHYNAPLLRRGRNGVTPTQAGTVVLTHARSMLATHHRMLDDLAALADEVKGPLRVTMNVGLAQTMMGAVLMEAARRYPELQIELTPDDAVVDIVAERYDLALRAGTMGHENTIARRIGVIHGVLVATPAYLDRVGRPQTPQDLIKLDYFGYRAENDAIATTVQRDGQVVQAPIRTTMVARLPDLVLQALQAGAGFAKAPTFLIWDRLETGELEQVLPGWSPEDKDLFLVYPERTGRARKVEAFVEILLPHLARLNGVSVLPSALPRTKASQPLDHAFRSDRHEAQAGL